MKFPISSLLLVLMLAGCGGSGTDVSGAPPDQPGPSEPLPDDPGDPPVDEPPTGEEPPADNPPYVVDYYGDSTIWGWTPLTDGARVDTPAPQAFFNALPAAPENDVRNEGVNGSTACGLLNGTDGEHPPWSEQMQASDANYVILNHGINDQNAYDLSQYRSCLTELARIARENGKVVVFETPNPVSSGAVADYAQAMRNVAAAQQPAIPVIDQHAFLLDYLDGASVDQIAPDGMHPNQETYILKGEYAADRFVALFPR